jgi:hypothetical protein
LILLGGCKQWPGTRKRIRRIITRKYNGIPLRSKINETSRAMGRMQEDHPSCIVIGQKEIFGLAL